MGQRVVIFSGSFGAGHDGAARALTLRLSEAGFGVDVYDYVDLLPGRLGPALRVAYEQELRYLPGSWGWLLRSMERHRPWANAAKGVAARLGASAVRRVLDTHRPAVVVSTYPLASQVLGGLRATARLSTPVVTYLTDLSVHPMWIAGGVDRHVALHPVAAAQAAALGASDVRVARPAVDPRFIRTKAGTAERAQARDRYGIPDERPVALVVAGSWGVGDISRTVRDLAATGLVTPVVVCGRNGALRAEVSALGLGVTLGWVDDMPDLFRASDVTVQNAGGLTSVESLTAGVPLLSYRCLPGHGVTNAAALDEAGLARWVRRPDDLAPTLREVLHGRLGHEQRLAATRQAIQPSPVELITDLVDRLAAGPHTREPELAR